MTQTLTMWAIFIILLHTTTCKGPCIQTVKSDLVISKRCLYDTSLISTQDLKTTSK
jgi:hypothetical protein